MRPLALLAALLLAVPAAAEFRPFGQQAPAEPLDINFCAPGKFLIYTGDCSPSSAQKDAISRKACSDVAGALADALPVLYPNSEVRTFTDLGGDELMETLLKPNVLGFFFIGGGTPKGGFVTGPAPDRVYPDVSACLSAFDLFGGFTSHSKFSPASPAPAAVRGRVLSRTETVFGGTGAPPESWAAFCKPKIAVVYPTRTFAGRMKGDVSKFLALLQDEKRRHVLKTLGAICDGCRAHLAAGDELARLCPPNSDVCKLRRITPGSEEFILKNYCAALAPVPSRQ